jgi:hypothetical protein
MRKSSVQPDPMRTGSSRVAHGTERNYSSYYGECLAAVWAVSYFWIYLYRRPFVLKTDHEPLKWLMTSEKLTGMHARWASIPQEYDVESNIGRVLLMGTLMGSRGTRYPVKRIGLMLGCIMSKLYRWMTITEPVSFHSVSFCSRHTARHSLDRKKIDLLQICKIQGSSS